MSDNTQPLSSYVDHQGIIQDTEFMLSQLKKVKDVLNEVAAIKIDLGKAKGTSQTFDGIGKSKQAITELSLAINEHKKIIDGIVRTQARMNSLSSESAKEYTKEKEALRQRNLELKNQVKEENNVKGSLEQRRAALSRLKAAYAQLAPSERDTAWGTRLQKVIAGVDEQVKKLEASMGVHSRNVGNYASGWNGLRNSVAQMTREFPAFTNSVQTGFLALSNNLPIFFDEIAKAKAEIKSLRAEGKETQGIFGRLVSSFFSWQSVLSIGVTLLVVYSKQIGEFFSALFKGKAAMDSFAESQRLIGESLKDTSGKYQSAVKAVSELKTNIELAKQGLLDKDKVVKQYNESIGKVTGEVKNLDEAERDLVKNGDAYIKMMLYKAAANLALEEAAKKAFEAEQTRRKDLKDFSSFTDFATANTGGNVEVFRKQEAERKKLNEQRRKKAADESEEDRKAFEDIAKKFQADAAKIAKDYHFDFFGDDGGKKDRQYNRKPREKTFDDEKYLKDLQDDYKKISEQENLQQQSRIAARKKAAEIESQIIEGQKEVEIANEIERLNAVKAQKDVSAQEIADATTQFHDKINKINGDAAYAQETVERNLARDIIDIKGSALAREADLDKKYNEDTTAALIDAETKKRAIKLKAIDDEKNTRTNNLSANRDEELARLEERFAAGKISQKKYNRERLEIEADYNARILQVELEAAKKLLALREAAGEDVTEQQRKINEIELKLAREKNEKKKKIDEEEIQRTQEKIQRIKEISLAVIDATSSIAGSFAERDKNRIQDQIDEIDRKREKEIEAANQTITNEQDKAAAIQTIQIRAQAKKEALERRQRQLDQERARFEKSAGIARIIVNTASAIMSALAMFPPNLPLAYTAGVVGAMELATAIAAPVPRYKEGTKEPHKGGFAIVGDGGQKEMVLLPSGESFATPDKPTLVNLPKGSEVFPNLLQAMKMNSLLSKPTIEQAPVQADGLLRRDVLQLNQTMLKVQETIKNKKETHIHGTYSGIVAMQKWAQNRLKYIDDEINF